MESENSSSALKRILEAIKSAQVVESRVQLVTELENLKLHEQSDLTLLVDSLTWSFWEDFTCLDISQCILNKSILHVAASILKPDISRCLVQFIALASKACKWCEKHLKMTLMSTDDSQEEEHGNIFFQLLSDFLSFSTAGFLALKNSDFSNGKDYVVTVEKFVLDQLNLVKEGLSEFKRIGALNTELLKFAQLVIDGAVSVCKKYSEAVDWQLVKVTSENDVSYGGCEAANITDRAISIIKATSEKFCELGIIAAAAGGSLVTILNVSWKGSVSLLQLGKGALATKVNIPNIILTLISLVDGAIKCAAEAWCSPLKEEITVADAKRTFLPVKFYLLNAVKIASLYPCQAYLINREIVQSVLIIYTFRVFLINKILLKTASEMLAELLDQISLNLLYPLLTSAQVQQKQKLEILDWLFINEKYINKDENAKCNTNFMVGIFSVNTDVMPGLRTLLLPRVDIYLTFLRNCSEFEDDVKLGIARKLGWLLTALTEEEVYSSILISQLPLVCSSLETVWRPMYSYVLLALKTFMIVVSSTVAWEELVSFLLENLFHPHFLCWEIVIELFCFLVRNADTDVVCLLTNGLCTLLKPLAQPESVLFPASALRKLARSICMIVSCTQSGVDYVYETLVREDGSLSSIECVALFMEGFPLNLLCGNRRGRVWQKMISNYFDAMKKFGEKPLDARKCVMFGSPVFTLSASLQSFQVMLSDINLEVLEFLVSIIQECVNSRDKTMKNSYLKLLGETLVFISNFKHLYTSDRMEEVILKLQNLFLSEPVASDSLLYQCKPNLSLFMAGFAHMEILDFDKCRKSFGVLNLYRMLLRERHWAVIHLSATAFAYFAARTNCNELWRFIPPDAALSFDLETGNTINEDTFMLEMKAFLDKDKAFMSVTFCSEKLGLLMEEGLALKKNVQKISDTVIKSCEADEVDTDCDIRCNKRRKLPDGIDKGVKLLQSGLKAFENGLSQWQQSHIASAELRDKFLTHFTRLEDEIAHLAGLIGNE